MSIWKINIYGNEDGQDALCCTVVARGDNAKDAEQLAEEDHVKNYPFLSKSPCAKSCGLASDREAQMLEEGENVSWITFELLHESDDEA
jgi:hypothetical protein